MHKLLGLIVIVTVLLPGLCVGDEQPRGDGTEGLLPTGFLVEGLLPVTVRLAEVKSSHAEHDQKAQLLLLTEDRIVYRNVKNEVERKRAGEVLAVESMRDRNQRWKFNKEKKIFTGRKFPPEPIDVQPVDCTELQQKQYLWSVLRRLYELTAGECDELGDLELTKMSLNLLRQDAERRAAYLLTNRLSSELREAYLGFAKHTEQQNVLVEKQKQVLAQSQQSVEQINQQLQATGLQSQAQASIAVTQGLGGVILDDGMLLGAMFGSLAQAQQAAQAHARLALEKKLLGERLTADLQAIQSEMKEKVKRGLSEIGRLAQQLQLPPLSDSQAWVERFQNDRSHRSLIERLDGMVAMWQRETGRPGPWLIAEAAMARACCPVGDRQYLAEELLKLARTCAAAVRYVPDGKAYDGDRAELLWTAGSIAARAAFLDHDTLSWREVYHPYAMYALRLYKIAEPFKQVDAPEGVAIRANGFCREHRIISLALAERAGEATQVGAELQETRNLSQGYHLYMARLRVLGGDKEQFLRHAEQLAGRGKLLFLRKCPEIVGLLNSSSRTKAEFQARTGPRLMASCTLKQVGFTRTPQLWIENTSAFNLTNIKGLLVVTTRFGSTRTAVNVPFLKKGEKISPPVTFSIGNTALLAFECDQGKKTVSVPFGN